MMDFTICGEDYGFVNKIGIKLDSKVATEFFQKVMDELWRKGIRPNVKEKETEKDSKNDL